MKFGGEVEHAELDETHERECYAPPTPNFKRLFHVTSMNISNVWTTLKSVNINCVSCTTLHASLFCRKTLKLLRNIIMRSFAWIDPLHEWTAMNRNFYKLRCPLITNNLWRKYGDVYHSYAKNIHSFKKTNVDARVPYLLHWNLY